VLLVPDMPGAEPIYDIENDIGDGAGIRVKRVNVYRKSVTREYRYDVLKHLSEIECKNVSDHAIITCLPQTIAANI
jgi:hypothetical protein